MPNPSLPPNVYRLPQRRFDAIPGSPWVYWVSDGIRRLFETMPTLDSVVQPRQGLVTGDNARFIRLWWECPSERVDRHCGSLRDAAASTKPWFPIMKTGRSVRWYTESTEVVNWGRDGREVRNFTAAGGRLASRVQNSEFYFQEGIAYSSVVSNRLTFRWMPGGYICEHASNAMFLDRQVLAVPFLLAILNSAVAHRLVNLNPTINVNISDLSRIPVPVTELVPILGKLSTKCIRLRSSEDQHREDMPSFIIPPRWDTGLSILATAQARLADLEQQIDDEVYRLYGVSAEDRAAIEAELAGGAEVAAEETEESTAPATEDEESPAATMTSEELAVRWISYAVGIVLGRFEPGVVGDLGSAIYRRSDFAVGSLPAPDEAEFDQLVGTPDRFAYVDADGGRHLFSPQVEAALQALAVPDGITVLDEKHPRDLAALVEKALDPMLGEHGKQEVVSEGAQGDLRGFLAGDFFRRWHLKWYRKRPVYWPLQSARRSYGFVVFHEKVERSFLYTLQRDYLDYKLNGLRLEIDDLSKRLAAQTGATRKASERQIDDARKTLDELKEFAKTMARIVSEGYEPAADWIDDGVILRLAPLWELLPLWKTEPKRFWAQLQNGDFDWSHIAMHYWPDRVRGKCTANKSFAIAHGHEEWYKGA